MDVIEYFREFNRMCASNTCDTCIMKFEKSPNGKAGKGLEGCKNFLFFHPKEAVNIIEKWAKEHPRKTNKDKFVEVFGSEIMQFIKINANACILSLECQGKSCKDCQHRYFWNQEYKEPKGSGSE